MQPYPDVNATAASFLVWWSWPKDASYWIPSNRFLEWGSLLLCVVSYYAVLTLCTQPYSCLPTRLCLASGHLPQTRWYRIMISQCLACERSCRRPSANPLVGVACQILLRYNRVLSHHGHLFSIIIAIVFSWVYRVPRGKSFSSLFWCFAC
jgi:hypothetical protein